MTEGGEKVQNELLIRTKRSGLFAKIHEKISTGKGGLLIYRFLAFQDDDILPPRSPSALTL